MSYMDDVFSLKSIWKVSTIWLEWKKVIGGKLHLILSMVSMNGYSSYLDLQMHLVWLYV